MGDPIVSTFSIQLIDRGAPPWGGTVPPPSTWSFVGIPFVTDGNLLTTAWPYNSTSTTSLAHPDFPDPWTSDTAGFYYIDNNTGTGTPTYGDPTAPLDQIPRIIPVGSVVVMAPGSYDVQHTSPDDITFQGTSVSQCWIVPFDVNDKPICRKKWEVNGDHAIIENINAASTLPLTDTSVMGISADSMNYLTVRGCDWSGNIAKGGWGVSNSTYVYIYDNDIHDCGDLDPASDIDQHGVNLVTSDDCWIISNRIYNCSGDSAQIGGQDVAGPTDSNRIYAAGNTCYGNRQTAIWVKEATDVIISENIAYDMTNGKFAAAIGFGAQYDHDHIWFLNNTVYDSHGGVKFQSGTGNQYVLGNLMYDISAHSGFDPTDAHDDHTITSRGGTTTIANNTLYRIHAGISLSGAQTVTIGNNIVGAVSFANASQLFIYDTTNKTIDYDYLYGPTSPIRFNGTTQKDLIDFKVAGFETNSEQSTDPGFTDEPGDDFTLASGSINLESGTVIAAYATFLARYGDAINTDIDGTTRPQSSLWDIGAFERDA